MATDHLKPHQFKKGESGNPGGRPNGPSPKNRMTHWLKQPEEDVRAAQRDTSLPLVDRIAAGMVVQALDSTIADDQSLILKFFDSMANRLDGMPTQKQEVQVAPLDVVQLEDRRKHKEIEE